MLIFIPKKMNMPDGSNITKVQTVQDSGADGDVMTIVQTQINSS